MAYKFQEQVRKRAEQFVDDLRATEFSAEILENSFRDYCVKVSISSRSKFIGNGIIYYSPKKDSYRMGTHEIEDQSYVSALEDVWFIGEDRDMHKNGEPTGWQIFPDGSHMNGIIGFGAVILKGGEVKHEISAPLEDADPDLLNLRQVAGEIFAVQSALTWLVDNGVKRVQIKYDYEGIEKWATGEWRAKNQYTQSYVSFIEACQIVIKWKKVDSHTGNRWNERADQLAKIGASQGKQSSGEEVDLVSEVDRTAQNFTEFLISNGVDASYQGVLNDQFARIVVPGKLRDNYLDIYNTKKKRLSPAWHDFRNDNFRDKAKSLWDEYRHGPSDQEKTSKADDRFNLADYYYRTLLPFRDLEFDFIDFAQELLQLSRSSGKDEFEISDIRYDFSELEEIYIRLKGQING